MPINVWYTVDNNRKSKGEHMIVFAKYFGFYPLGSDIEYGGLRFMQMEWNEYKKPLCIIGKKNVVSPLFCQAFYVIHARKCIFFAAHEYGLGKYHIFTFSPNTNLKLLKKINGNDYSPPCALIVNKKEQSIKIFGRYVSPRDMNRKCSDSFYSYLKTIEKLDHIEFEFTNNGQDRYYLKIYSGFAYEETDTYIIIASAEKIVFCGECTSKFSYEYEMDINNYIHLKEDVDGKTNEIIFR